MSGSLGANPPPPPLPRVSQSDRTGPILMSGEFDMSAHEALHTTLTAAIERHARGDLVVDMSDVTFIDAGSVGLLLEAWQAAANRHVRLRVTGVTGIVRRVIQTCGALVRLTGADDDMPVPDDIPLPVGEADGLLAEDQVRLRDRLDVIDTEVRTTRRAILNDLRDKLENNHSALTNDDLLTVTDGWATLDAIILAATIVGGADACDLQVYDPETGSLTIIRHRGFTDEFLTRFGIIKVGDPTSCAVAAATGEPVIVDDVAHSPLFAADPAGLAVLLAAGSNAVQSHPLRDDDGRTIGVLSFHYRTANPRRGQPELVAWWAEQALGRATSN